MLFKHLSKVPALGRVFRILGVRIIGSFLPKKYAGLMEYGSSVGAAYFIRRALYMPWELPQFLGAEMVEKGLADLNLINRMNFDIEGISNDRLKVSILEMKWYMKNQLLRDSDWASMAHSVEIRVPLVDVVLMKSIIPLIAKYPSISKQEIAKQVFPSIPIEILMRKKSGFSVPINSWLKSRRDPKVMRHLSKNLAHHVYGIFSAFS